MSQKTLFTDIDLIAGDELEHIADGWLLIEGSTILGYGAGRAPKGEDRVLSLPGVVILPAFIDAHTHIGDTLAKEAGIGKPTIEAVSPPNGMKYRLLRQASHADLVASIKQGAEEMLSNGIALIGDFREGGTMGIELFHQAVKGLPLHAVLFGEPDWQQIQHPSYTELIDPIVQQCDGLGIGDVANFTEGELQRIASCLSRSQKVLAVHAAETSDAQQRCLRTWDASEIERIATLAVDTLLIHVTHPTQQDVRLIEQYRLPIVLCPRANAILGDGIPPVATFVQKGIPFALGSDNMMFSSPDMFREMDMLSRIVRGLSKDPAIIESKKILAAATINGAKALRKQSLFGSIKPGKRASFIGIDTKSSNLRYEQDVFSALVHRAGVQDIVLRYYDGVPFSPSSQEKSQAEIEKR